MLFKIWKQFQRRVTIVRWIPLFTLIAGVAVFTLGGIVQQPWLIWLGLGLSCLVVGEIAFLGYLVYQEWPTDIKEEQPRGSGGDQL